MYASVSTQPSSYGFRLLTHFIAKKRHSEIIIKKMTVRVRRLMKFLYPATEVSDLNLDTE